MIFSIRLDVLRQENNRINYLHETALKIMYNNYESTFEHPLELDIFVFIPHRNIRLLSIESNKVKHNLSNQVMSELFKDTIKQLFVEKFQFFSQNYQ